MLDESSGKQDRVVSVEIEASELLQQLAGASSFGGGNVKAAIRRAAVRSGLTFGRARSIWYRQARIWATEMDQLRARAAAAREAQENELRRYGEDVARKVAALEIELAALRRELALPTPDGAGGATDPRV